VNKAQPFGGPILIVAVAKVTAKEKKMKGHKVVLMGILAGLFIVSLK
jgi:hypothetical protein